FFHEEKRHLTSNIEPLSLHSLGYNITNSEPGKMYEIRKQVISNPDLPCVLQNIKIDCERELIDQLNVFVLCAPHLEGGGMGNNAFTLEVLGRKIVAAQKGDTWLTLAASVPFTKTSAGFVGFSDGWRDVSQHFGMDWEFGKALNGNVALTAQLDLSKSSEFVLALAFGNTLQNSISCLLQSLSTPFDEYKKLFVDQWASAYKDVLPLERYSVEKTNLYHASYRILLAHEDKRYPGAMIASLTIPWGEAANDADRGGYHLVWTRDMCNTATALLAAGDTIHPLHALIYLAACQNEDGGFPQNFWIDGEPFWNGIQLDEVSFPILLAWHLHKDNALKDFDPYEMVMRAASYLIKNGPATQQERWEEASGYSPSTLAVNIVALICAADYARTRGEESNAQFMEEYADFLEGHIEEWTVTTSGTLVPGIDKHYIRICPVHLGDQEPSEDPNNGQLKLANQPPNGQETFPAKEIIDAGFLELVRYGVRAPDDCIIVDSLKVVDAFLKIDTPFGPVWRRYNHDGYGQKDDGRPYTGWGKGRGWPLLTGERGHYEVALGNRVKNYISAMEKFASPTGLLPEQVWDQQDIKELHLFFGGPTGAAMPLAWAHSEYIKLLRSASDGKVFDLVPEVKERYMIDRSRCKRLEIWKPNRRPRLLKYGRKLRVQMTNPFRIHYSIDEWRTTNDADSKETKLGVYYVDIGLEKNNKLMFTFFWPLSNQWEGKDYCVSAV
ncbi:MAG: glucan 1,4-alpha-glucosidase, partial [Nitrososphaerota archaeon]|nr:glucan 1,4-alpha-glucosidase [Nitrososphaerota archaeon]